MSGTKQGPVEDMDITGTNRSVQFETITEEDRPAKQVTADGAQTPAQTPGKAFKRSRPKSSQNVGKVKICQV
jgi:hypothetical protein